jgi:hypothetical protein
LSEQKTDTPPEALAKAGLIDKAIVSYKISRLADNKNDGEITFGYVQLPPNTEGVSNAHYLLAMLILPSSTPKPKSLSTM